MKQGTWWVWDSRGGINNEPTHIQAVDFDLEHNIDAWRKAGASITGSMEAGRFTVKALAVTVEYWRDGLPNPTPYTVIDNPDPWDEGGKGDLRTGIIRPKA